MQVQFTQTAKKSENLSLQTDLPPKGTAIDQLQTSARLTDDYLLSRISEGDANAFRVLTQRHIDRAFGLAFRILGNSADAEDVVQDCFVKVWTMGKTWEPGRAAFSTWLYRVITNRCLDFKRRPQNAVTCEVPKP